ncbi:zinc knuckle [Opisthorchis viverrini]|uniref:Zinc knuckle n=1 Tax=Opisthorchis viverrini TaxID=6198 RepID=A0A1S8X559_OPIVI|nr:zinc knuckle [Opisthorchis viverrini]
MKAFDELVFIVSKHYNPKASGIAQRFKFNTRVQKERESITDFVAELRSLTEHCEYRGFRNDTLRDRLVVGVRNARIQKCLLADSNLTLETAYDTAVALEAAENNATLLQSVQPTVTSESVDSSYQCYRCGGRHNHPKDCRHTQTVCNRCKKRGHLAKVCRSAPAFDTNAAVTNQVTRSEIPEYVLHAAAPTNRVQPPYQVELQVNSAPMVFELDTGSAVTLYSEKSLQGNLGLTVKGKFQQAPVRLRTYTGEEVKLLGTKNVKGVTVNETIYIVEGSGPNLLGRDWLQQPPILTLNQVSTLPEVQSLIRNYEEVFSEPNTGKFSGGKVNIYVSPGTQPRFLKARSLSYLMRPKVEEELNRLQREGIIQSTEFPEWATPIVPVLKPDGTVRICGDYKTTVNASTPPEHYPLPKIEDVYAQIASGPKKRQKVPITVDPAAKVSVPNFIARLELKFTCILPRLLGLLFGC